MFDPRAKLLPEGRRHEGNSLVRGSNIAHVDREIVNKCFVIYSIFSCDVTGQHCDAGPTSIYVDRSTLRCARTFELLDFLLYIITCI